MFINLILPFGRNLKTVHMAFKFDLSTGRRTKFLKIWQPDQNQTFYNPRTKRATKFALWSSNVRKKTRFSAGICEIRLFHERINRVDDNRGAGEILRALTHFFPAFSPCFSATSSSSSNSLHFPSANRTVARVCLNTPGARVHEPLWHQQHI